MLSAKRIIDHSQYSYKQRERLQKESHMLTKAISLAAERLDGYVIEDTEIPYFMVVLGMANNFRECDDIEYVLAGIINALYSEGLISEREVCELEGEWIFDLFKSDAQDQLRSELEDRFFNLQYAEGIRLWNWRRTDWKEDANLISDLKEATLLQFLSMARAKHDREFVKNNPMPKRVCWIPGKSNRGRFCGDCEDCLHDENCNLDKVFEGGFLPSKDYYAEGENKFREHNRPWYIKSGYTDREFECPLYVDEEAEEWNSWEQLKYVRYFFTLEYMEYCDRCSEEFWKQFGLTYEEAKRKLEYFFPLLHEENELNDVLYHLVVTNEELYSNERSK